MYLCRAIKQVNNFFNSLNNLTMEKLMVLVDKELVFKRDGKFFAVLTTDGREFEVFESYEDGFFQATLVNTNEDALLDSVLVL